MYNTEAATNNGKQKGKQQYLQGGGPQHYFVLQSAVSRNLLQQCRMDGVTGQRLVQHDVMTAQQLKLCPKKKKKQTKKQDGSFK